ncbi:MAG TPA: hypothetical protein VKY92_06160 [Verrucomicrobiae bacterium]|nr:hypothetical protein [Verrucomicrobiae bacterium]
MDTHRATLPRLITGIMGPTTGDIMDRITVDTIMAGGITVFTTAMGDSGTSFIVAALDVAGDLPGTGVLAAAGALLGVEAACHTAVAWGMAAVEVADTGGKPMRLFPAKTTVRSRPGW